MGDRISIQYKNGDEKSVYLFSHWQGKALLNIVKEHYEKVVKPLHDQNGDQVPLSRMEPCTVIVDLIRYIVKDHPFEPIATDIYLTASESDGDNSDNGHYIFDLVTGKFTHKKGRYEG
jgi:hypothetical protein